MPTLYEAMIKIGVDTSEVDAGMDKAKESVSGFGNTAKGVFAGNLLYNGFTKISGAVTNFIKGSIQTGMSFDGAMSRVQATMLKTSEEMEKSIGSVDTVYGHFQGNLREFAQFLGENTAFSATQAAEALNYMALAGYDTQQSMEMLPNVLNLAAAGHMDLARASDMVTDAQTAFGISSNRTTQMVDEMAKAASVSNTSVEQLGDAFLVVGGLARELNGGMVKLADGTMAPVDGVQELEIALGAMANAGIKGSEAGTHMRNMLMKLSGPTSEGTEMLESLGVSVFDTEGKMRSLSDIFGDLNSEFANMTQQGKLEAIQALFNTRDLASAESLLSSIEGEYVKVGDDIYSIGTAYEKWGDAIYDSSQGFEYVQSSWDSIGEAVLNAKDAGSAMADIQLDNLTGAMTLFRSALEGAQIAIADKLTPTLGKFVGKGTQLLQDMTKIFRERGLQSVIDYGVGFIRGLAGSMSQSLPELIPVAMNALMTFSGSLRENVGNIVDAGLELIMTLAQALIDNLPVFIQTVPTIVSNIAGIISDNAPKLLEAGLHLIMMLGQGIIDSWPTIVAEFPKIIQAIWDVWTAINWISLGTNLITAIWTGIKNLAQNVPNLLDKIGKDGLNMILKTDWIGLGSKVISMIVSGIQALFSSIPSLLRSIATNGTSAFKGINWAGVGHAVINLLASGVRGVAHLVASALRSVGSSAMSAFRNINWYSLGSNIISGIVSGIAGAGGSLFSSLRSLASSALASAKSVLRIGSPSKVFRDEVGRWIPEGMAVGITDNASVVDDALSGIADPSDFDFGGFDYEIINENDNKPYSASGDATVASYGSNDELIGRVNYLIQLLEYYMPKRTSMSSKEIDRVLGAML